MHALAIIDDIQSQIYERRTAAAWKSIHEFGGRKSAPLSCIKASSIDEVKETLRRHYANVLKRPHHPSSINDNVDVATVSPDLDPLKSPVPSRLTSFELPCLHPNFFLSSGFDGIPVIALRIEMFESDILDSINQSSKMVDTECNIPSQLLYLFPKRGLHSL